MRLDAYINEDNDIRSDAAQRSFLFILPCRQSTKFENLFINHFGRLDWRPSHEPAVFVFGTIKDQIYPYAGSRQTARTPLNGAQI